MMIRQVLFFTLFCVYFEAISSKPKHSVVVDIAQDGSNFRGQIQVAGKLHHLNLRRPEESTFAPNFRLTETIRAPNGEITLVDIPHNIHHMDANILEDPEAQAVFRIEEVDGEKRFHGMLENIHISHDGEEHFAIVHDFSSPNALQSAESGMVRDRVLLIDRPLTFHNSTLETLQVKSFQPEVFLTMDTALYEALGRNDSNVQWYLSVLMRGVNNRYATVDDPKIKMVVVGATVLKNRSEQPFIEAGNQGSRYDISPVLQEFSKYMFENQGKGKFPKHDLSPLISGENYGTAIGLAWFTGACAESIGGGMSGKTSVSQDRGGVWAGIHTLAHEICHNLGGPHDGDKFTVGGQVYDTTSCPWNDGYIMSYRFNAINSLTFSKCSQKYMKEFLGSDQGTCLRSAQGPDPWKEGENPGEHVSYDRQCQNAEKRAGNSLSDQAKADWTKTPAQLCAQLLCRWKTSSGSSSRRHNTFPLDGTPCDNGAGKCLEGKCV